MIRKKEYSITEARSNLPSIVREAEAGLEVQLNRRGKPIAVLISIQEFERLHADRPSFVEACREFLKEHPAEGLGLDREFIDSLRDKDTGREVSL